MKKFYYNMVSFLLLAGTILAACSEIEPAEKNIEPGHTYVMRVHATKADPATKSLKTQGEGRNQVIRSYWDPKDELKVYDVDDTQKTLIATLVATATATCEETDFVAELTQEQVAKLRAAGNGLLLEYKSASYSSQDGTLESLSACDFSTLVVNQFDINNDTFNITIDKALFACQQAIVQFKIENGLGNLVDVRSMTVDYGYGSFTVQLGTPASKFFVAVPESPWLSLSAEGTDGRTYTYAKGTNIFVKAVANVLENGYYYPIAVRMQASPKLGDPYYSDGTWASCNKHAAGAEAVGIVVYLGGGELTEEASGFGHGLVMALKDASQGEKWAKENGEASKDRAAQATTVLVNYGGIAKTAAMDNEKSYPAAYTAYHYPVTVDKTKCSGWFLPSSGQWISVVYGLCGAQYPDKSKNTWWKNGAGNDWGSTATDIAKVLYPATDEGYAHKIINKYLAEAGDYDEIITVIGKDNWVSYWSSTEATNADAIRMNFGIEKAKEEKYSSIKADKKPKSTALRVRAFLAF